MHWIALIVHFLWENASSSCKVVFGSTFAPIEKGHRIGFAGIIKDWHTCPIDGDEYLHDSVTTIAIFQPSTFPPCCVDRKQLKAPGRLGPLCRDCDLGGPTVDSQVSVVTTALMILLIKMTGFFFITGPSWTSRTTGNSRPQWYGWRPRTSRDTRTQRLQWFSRCYRTPGSTRRTRSSWAYGSRRKERWPGRERSSRSTGKTWAVCNTQAHCQTRFVSQTSWNSYDSGLNICNIERSNFTMQIICPFSPSLVVTIDILKKKKKSFSKMKTKCWGMIT